MESEVNEMDEIYNLASLEVRGQLKEAILETISRQIQGKGVISKFGYPIEYDQKQTELDFSTLHNLVLFNKVSNIEELLKLVRSIFDEFRESTNRALASSTLEAEKELMRELRKIPILENLTYNNYKNVCEQPEVQTRQKQDITGNQIFEFMGKVACNKELVAELLSTASLNNEGEKQVDFNKYQLLEIVRNNL